MTVDLLNGATWLMNLHVIENSSESVFFYNVRGETLGIDVDNGRVTLIEKSHKKTIVALFIQG